MAEESDDDDKQSCVLSSPKEETPIRAVVCLKNKKDVKRFEETEECFILDFDPFESLDLSKLSLDDKSKHAGDDDDDDAADISIIAEKGPVACRDYPHSRHLCLKFPFTTTPHKSYCEMCFCYVCDLAAPCKCWTDVKDPHCDADSSCYWKNLRDVKKLLVGTVEKAH